MASTGLADTGVTYEVVKPPVHRIDSGPHSIAKSSRWRVSPFDARHASPESGQIS